MQGWEWRFGIISWEIPFPIHQKWHLRSPSVQWSYLGLCSGQTVGMGLSYSQLATELLIADCFRKETCKWCSPAPHNHEPPGRDLLLLLKIHLHGGPGSSLQPPLSCCLFVALCRAVMALNSSIHSQGWYFGGAAGVGAGAVSSLCCRCSWQHSRCCTLLPLPGLHWKPKNPRAFPGIWAPQGPSQSSPKTCSCLFQITPSSDSFPLHLLAAMATDPTQLNPQKFSGIQLCSVKYLIKESRTLPTSPGTQIKSSDLNSIPSLWNWILSSLV